MARAMLVPRRDRSWLASGLKGVKGVKGVKGWEEGVELSGLGYLALVPLLVWPLLLCYYFKSLLPPTSLLQESYFYNYLLLAYCPLRTNIPVHT